MLRSQIGVALLLSGHHDKFATVDSEVSLDGGWGAARGSAFGFVRREAKYLSTNGTLPRQHVRFKKIAGNQGPGINTETHSSPPT